MIVRIGIAIVFLPIMFWVALVRIWDEVKSIPFYVWCDWRENIDGLRPVWRKGRIDPEDIEKF